MAEAHGNRTHQSHRPGVNSAGFEDQARHQAGSTSTAGLYFFWAVRWVSTVASGRSEDRMSTAAEGS